MKTKVYLAYGSNLNIPQMRTRCPGAKIVGTGEIKDCRLLFKGSLTGAYLTIELHKGASVPVAAWEVTREDEVFLDRYEGYPRFYTKENIRLPITGIHGGKKTLDAFCYVMRKDALPGLPSGWYFEVCREGYRTFGFDEKELAKAVRATKEEMRHENTGR